MDEILVSVPVPVLLRSRRSTELVGFLFLLHYKIIEDEEVEDDDEIVILLIELSWR